MAKWYLNENNSGGSFWLSMKNYTSLLSNGWKLSENWDKRGSIDPYIPFGGKGDDVPYGYRHDGVYFEGTEQEAINSFESLTPYSYDDEGCTCCGRPFSIWEGY